MANQARSLPKIGEAFDGGKYIATLTNAAGELYTLTKVAVADKAASWSEQMAWAKGLGCDLLSPTEAQLLREVAPDEFPSSWIWLNRPQGSSTAWYCSSDGTQGYGLRSAEGGAVAVRRSLLGSFDPFADASKRAIDSHGALRAAAESILKACDDSQHAVAELGMLA